MRILQDDGQRTAKIIFGNEPYIDSVISYAALIHIIETVDQICDRCFAGTGGADEGDLLSRLCIQRNIFQYLSRTVVAECDMIKAYIALQFDQLDLFVLTRMAPSP